MSGLFRRTVQRKRVRCLCRDCQDNLSYYSNVSQLGTLVSMLHSGSMLSHLDLIGTIQDDEDVPEDPDSESDNEDVSVGYLFLKIMFQN